MARADEYAAVQDYLFSLKAGGVKFGLDRMQVLAGELGHPERAVPVIHVAGTNGKGSTAAMLAAIFRQAGWKTGLYTSPHLVRLGERIQVAGRILTEDEIVRYVAELRPIAERIAQSEPGDRPSFFEFMTAMAFLQFARQKCDIAIVEVGMGGRLDATNVVDPVVSAITSIGLDHCEELGDTLEKIAAEKAGIVKPGRPVVLGLMPGPAETVIRDIAAGKRSEVIAVGEVYNGGEFPRTNLPGEYQRWNAATATLVARQMPPRWKLAPATIAAGLQEVSWPARWQRTTVGDRTVILDTSHNPEGAAVLDSNLKALMLETRRKPIIVVGVLGEARARAILDVVARHAAEILLAVPAQARSSSYEQLEAILPAGTKSQRVTVDSVFPAPNTCAAGRPGDTIVVTGSIYLAGEVLHKLSPAGVEEQRLQDF